MTTTLNELLGDQLIQNNESAKEISTNELHGKTIAFYFSAHWCPPCRSFTSKLAKFYSELNDEMKSKFDIIFLSWDENEEDFKEYFKEMPWKALPFSDRQRSEKLGEHFQINSIPTLIVLSSSLEIITSDGVDEVLIAPEQALRKYCEGKRLFWSREAQEGEHIWENIQCSQCFLSPLIGSRRGCANRQCQFNLCQNCLSNKSHEHPLIEYLISTKEYSLEKLLSSIPYLLHPDKEDEEIPIKSIVENNIGIYFSAHWCSPCRIFTPKLAEIYKEIKNDFKNFEILFISSDQDEDSFNNYRSEMPWLAAPLNSTEFIKQYFQISGIPSFIILSSDGRILSRNGRAHVGQYGVQAFKTWARGEKLSRPSPDEYRWDDVTCDGCKIKPIIGLRYHCPTCGNYDLCSECEKKGHEHPLGLEQQPNYVE